ncbi:site-specific integrase [Actinomyces radicidentis]|uniref:tyrosine-type recombinase/integrase n=1 Tax=Actinomyces radicidentis TaxID=111015 RepID=UPI0028E63BFF|nr:site-specific integrase [Actinomyces radicidentis]
MASIRVRERRDGSVAHYVIFRRAGRQTSLTFDDPVSATRFRRLVEEVGGDAAVEALSATLTAGDELESLADYGAGYVDRLTGVQPATRHRYRSMLASPALRPLAPLPLASVTPDRVRAWVNAQEADGASAKTIANRHGLVSALLADAVARGVIDRNPAAGTRLPRARRAEMVCLTPAQLASLLRCVHPHYRPLVRFLATSGLRWSEATALEVADLDTEAGTVRVDKAWKKVPGGFELGAPKTRRGERTVGLAPQVVADLERLTRDCGARSRLFVTQSGGTVRHNSFHPRVWAPAVRLANGEPAARVREDGHGSSVLVARRAPLEGVDVIGARPRIHDLRHTAASWWIASGLDLLTVQHMLGHESVTTTSDLYGHLLPEQTRAASEAMGRMVARAR